MRSMYIDQIDDRPISKARLHVVERYYNDLQNNNPEYFSIGPTIIEETFKFISGLYKYNEYLKNT